MHSLFLETRCLFAAGIGNQSAASKANVRYGAAPILDQSKSKSITCNLFPQTSICVFRRSEVKESTKLRLICKKEIIQRKKELFEDDYACCEVMHGHLINYKVSMSDRQIVTSIACVRIYSFRVVMPYPRGYNCNLYVFMQRK